MSTRIKPKLKINLGTESKEPVQTGLSVEKVAKESRMKLRDEGMVHKEACYIFKN